LLILDSFTWFFRFTTPVIKPGLINIVAKCHHQEPKFMNKIKDSVNSANKPEPTCKPSENNLDQYDQLCEKVHQLAAQFKEAKKKKHFKEADQLLKEAVNLMVKF
jgi:hypothetical protein